VKHREPYPAAATSHIGLAEGAMDDDVNAAERFRLPGSFAGSDDPVETNPYPVGHPAHQLWLEMTRQAQAEVFGIDAGAHEALSPETADEWMQRLVVAKFDAWARRGAQFVSTDEAEWQ